ncbi:hypothetical protein FVE85_4526 [Porphyridium purpureum]|uniref:Uncharacterized protein n=1 Tax=Porphyridium purpureum TaxID=35688 RepID=A0A5J4YI87_PORPP|nr:hypothetical protein FVE85_4526 [Porphyridium purpureum]|eukprot:POR2532..scf297_16
MSFDERGVRMVRSLCLLRQYQWQRGRCVLFSSRSQETWVRAFAAGARATSPPWAGARWKKEKVVARFKIQHEIFGHNEDAQAPGQAPRTPSSSAIIAEEATPKTSLDKYLPLSFRQLRFGTSNPARYIFGQVAVADSFFKVGYTYFLLQDLKEDLVQVRVLGTKKIYKVGEVLAVVEPFYDFESEQAPTVCVDRLGDILAWEYPKSALEWKEKGNTCVKEGDGEAAALCYEHALASPDLVPTLEAMSVCYDRMGQSEFQLAYLHDVHPFLRKVPHLYPRIPPATKEARRHQVQKAACYSGTAVALNRRHDEAWIRVITMMEQAEMFDAAFEVGEEAPLLGSDLEPSYALPIRARKSAATGFSAWGLCVIDWSTLPTYPAETEASPTEPFDWQHHHEHSEIVFEQGAPYLAKDMFLKELQERYHATARQAAVLFSNLGLAHEMEGNWADALLYSSVSCVLDRQNVKPWLRRSRMLAKVGYAVEGQAWLEELSSQVEASELCWPSKSAFLDSCRKEIENLKDFNAELRRLQKQKEEKEQEHERIADSQRFQRFQEHKAKLQRRREAYPDIEGLILSRTQDTPQVLGMSDVSAGPLHELIPTQEHIDESSPARDHRPNTSSSSAHALEQPDGSQELQEKSESRQ